MKKFNNYFIDDFLFEKELNQGIRKTTIKTYQTCFTVLINNDFIDVDNPNSFTEINFKRLLGDLFTKNNWSSHTYNRYKKNYKVFCDYLVKEGYILENPLSKMKDRKLDKCLPKIFTQKQVDSILYTIRNFYPSDDFISKRNIAIIYTYLLTGMRLNELVHLNYSNVNLEEGYIKIVNGKGGKDRYVPIINKLDRLLNDYLNYRKDKNFKKEILFPTRYGNYLQHRDIYVIMKSLEKRLGFKITCHMFRHTFATELVKKNLNIYSISQILGHTKLDTTKIYLNFDTEKVKETINSLNIFA